MIFTSFCTLQKSLKEFFPSWEHIKVQEEVIVFTCGLMKDPTPLVNHVYEAYVEMACSFSSPGNIKKNLETQSRLQALGKKIGDINLLKLLYMESRVPLFRQPHYNQFVCINENHNGEIDTPSKLYAFLEMSEDDVPVTKFAEEESSKKSPECIMYIHKPDAAAVKSLLSTCCEISKRQPVTHLMINEVTCKDVTPPEAPALSRNVQAICVVNCDLPISFWKNILHQLFDCVHLRSLWFTNTNLHQLEENLDELFEHLNSNTRLTNHQVDVILRENNFSRKFVKKWNRSNSGIACNFYNNLLEMSESSEQASESIDEVSEYSEEEDDLTMDEINWLIGEQPHPGIDINFSTETITAMPFLDFGCINLGFDARHIKNIIQVSWLTEVCLRDCQIPSVISGYLLSAMCACTSITHLDMSGNTIDKYGHDLAETIQAWGPKPALKELDLSHCSMPTDACRHLLSALGSCRQLSNLWLPGNTLTGSLSSFIPEQHAGLHSLEELFLNYTALNKRDLLHLTH